MNPEVLRTNTLSIVVAGLLIVLTGVILYVFRERISDNVRFFMPIPPLGVAAYIFVFNLYSRYDGRLPPGNWVAAREIILSTAVAAIAYGVFTLLIIGVISLIKPYS